MTLERAMGLLSLDDEDTLVRAACHIQNQCLKSADAKKIVCSLYLYALFDRDSDKPATSEI